MRPLPIQTRAMPLHRLRPAVGEFGWHEFPVFEKAQGLTPPRSEKMCESGPLADPLLKLWLVDIATADGDDDVAGAAEVGQAVEHYGGGDGS